MVLQVDSVRLPLAVEASARWLITTETHKTGGFNNRETRNAKRRPRVEASVRVGPAHANFVRDLMYSQWGDRYAFTARDWGDYLVSDEPTAHHAPQEIVVDDDGNWPLIITYGPGTRKFTRRIMLPDEDTLQIFVNGDLLSGGYTVLPGGLIQFNSGNDPVSGDVVTWAGEFFFAARIDEDTMEIETATAQNDGPPIRFTTFRLVEVQDPEEPLE
jgi:uncharacterized protein (TIGR02217 family)